MSLRVFHVLFVLAAIIITDMFGAWAIWEHAQTHDHTTLVFGVISFLIGFALIGYGLWVVRKLDASRIK